MPISAFADKEHQPSFDEVCAIVGSRLPLWLALNEFVFEFYGLPGEWKFGGKSYGWNICFRKSGRTLVSFYPQAEGLTTQLVLGQAQVPQALNLKLNAKVRRVLLETPQLHDGRWLFIPVRTERDVRDIEQLVLVKAPPKRRRSASSS